VKNQSDLAQFVAKQEDLSELPDVRARQVRALRDAGKISQAVAEELMPRTMLALVKSS
jgi:hypothetical protein